MLLIATPGTPASTPGSGGTVKGIAHTRALELDAMEIEWVQRVPNSIERVQEIAEAAKEHQIALTVHAPYFINLNTDDTEKLSASKKRILDALSMAQVAGAVSVCVHAAFNQGKSSKEVTDNVLRATDEIMKRKQTLFPSVSLAYETMGKPTQWGTVEEVLIVSKEFDLVPTIDISHLYARTGGGYNDEDSWNMMFDQIESALGVNALSKMHLHVSGIEFGPKGEKKHLPFPDSGFDWKGYLKVLKKRSIGGILVCESPLMEEEAMLLKKEYVRIM